MSLNPQGEVHGEVKFLKIDVHLGLRFYFSSRDAAAAHELLNSGDFISGKYPSLVFFQSALAMSSASRFHLRADGFLVFL